ncbi:BsuPI-related putative proteinase inhibitor [Bacillus sp. JCM 19034]|uniref:BsuPI-related putative proteinase inhibitor n=1 Tax=Bacillus sp. JCM 19034 TaxID=1481928 RepID=UPI000782BD39|nr:BsuPI-related putative proteinase inhibitor [Bacillus sp. JCM 19034]
MKKGYIWVGMLILLVLVACGQGGNTPTSGSEGEEEMEQIKEWSYEVETVQKDNELHVTMTVSNHLEKASEIEFSSGQQYELIIRDESDEVLYRYSEGKMFTMAIMIEQLSPGESLTFSEAIPLDGIDSGQYELEAKLLIVSIDGNEPEDGMFKKEERVEIN